MHSLVNNNKKFSNTLRVNVIYWDPRTRENNKLNLLASRLGNNRLVEPSFKRPHCCCFFSTEPPVSPISPPLQPPPPPLKQAHAPRLRHMHARMYYSTFTSAGSDTPPLSAQMMTLPERRSQLPTGDLEANSLTTMEEGVMALRRG